MALPDQIGAPRDLTTFQQGLMLWAQAFDQFMARTNAIANAYSGVDFTGQGTTAQATEWNAIVAGLAGLPGNATIQAIASHASKIREIRN